MAVVQQRVVPALVETALSLGNAGVTAVTQLGRAAKPVVEESAAHMHHVVSHHIVPGKDYIVKDVTLDNKYR